MESLTNLRDGSILAARYAFMPNRLRYCGGDANADLFSYASNRISDRGLDELLKEFETMYPYLRLIAEANKITNTFDYRVVEAYWLGNELLENVSLNGFYRHLVDEQRIKAKIKPKLLELVFGKIPLGAKPHHSWHIFNIPKRSGYYPVEHTLETMDKCRITWGRVIDIPKNIGGLDGKVTIEYRPLQYINNKLSLGESINKDVWFSFGDAGFVDGLAVGDLVSIHWDWVCDRLSEKQKNNLDKWTIYNLNLANISKI